MSARRRRDGACRPLVAGALLLALLVAACDWSSSDNDASPDAHASPSSAPAPRVTATPDPLDQTPALERGGVMSTFVPGMPSSVAAGFGSVWVTAHRGQVVFRIDPRTSRPTAAIAVPDALCAPPRFGAGFVWVFTCNDGDTYRIDPATNRIAGKFRGHGQQSGPPVYGAGSLWATEGSRVLRRDPRSGIVLARIRPRIPTSAYWFAFAAGHRSLWVYSDTAVSRIDTDTNRVRAVIPLRGAKPSTESATGYCYGGLGAVTDGRLWVSNCAGIYEIDPSTDTARLHRMRIGPLSEAGDVSVTEGSGSLWVRPSENEVLRIDPKRFTVLGRYRATGGGGHIAVAFNRLWITSAGDDRLLRVNIRAGGDTTGNG
jgi:streptogramin lyase